VIEKFSASTTGLKLDGGLAAAGKARSARQASVASRPALKRIGAIPPQIVPTGRSGQSVTVSRLYSERYESAARTNAASAEEIAAGVALRRIAAEEPPLPEDRQLAERIGFALERAARPSRCPVPRRALDELRDVVRLALARGRAGEVDPGDYLPELLLRRSPRIAGQIRARVYSPLDGDHAELARTLDVLIKCNFEKSRAAAALPVHRNTLHDRIARISELTGVDLECAEGRGLAWLAWLGRVSS
jgi:hypothetical protein